jgi:hypothetical protein
MRRPTCIGCNAPVAWTEAECELVAGVRHVVAFCATCRERLTLGERERIVEAVIDPPVRETGHV